MDNSNFYCQNTCGAVEFSIDEWNEVEKSTRSLPETDRQDILFPKACNQQCFTCMSIVGERQLKTIKLSTMDNSQKQPVGDFTCKGCNCKLTQEFSLRTEGWCYLCDPNITLDKLLSDNPIDRRPASLIKEDLTIAALLEQHKEDKPKFQNERMFPVSSVVSIIEKLRPKWIPVTDRLPDPLQACNFIIDMPDSTRHGKVYGGTYTGDPGSAREDRRNEFSTPGIGWNASHWIPSPIPGTNGPVT